MEGKEWADLDVKSDETAVNKIVQKGAVWAGKNWRLWGGWLLSAIVIVFGLVKTYGYNQGQTETTTKVDAVTLTTIAAKVDAIKKDVDQVKNSQSEMKGQIETIVTLSGQFSAFKTQFQQGAQEALSTPIPKGPKTTGHRAKQ